MKRILLAALVGGIVMFLWGAFSHMVLPLGEVGISTLPREEAVLDALRGNIPEAGLYFFPGLPMDHRPSAAERQAWEERYRTGPAGLLVFHPQGGEPLTVRQLGIELGTNLLAAWVAALLLSQLVGGYAWRAAAVGLLGLFGWLSISVSYWDWYGFPGAYVLGEGFDQLVGWLIVGLVVAPIVRPPAR